MKKLILDTLLSLYFPLETGYCDIWNTDWNKSANESVSFHCMDKRGRTTIVLQSQKTFIIIIIIVIFQG